MKRTRNGKVCCLASAVSLAFMMTASFAEAQALPTDPWAAQEQQAQAQQPAQQATSSAYGTTSGVVQVQQVGPVVYGSQPYQPTYEGGSDNIWNTKMPEFTGEMTTWGTDYGQRATAPEVNMHNILSIAQHLRNMGYKIPTSFENKVKAAPAATRTRIFNAMKAMKKQNDPFSQGARMVLKQFEKETGLSYENLIGNSLDLMSAK